VDRPTREEILAIYRAGPEAVVALVEGLVRRLAAVEGRVAALEDRVALDSHNSSKPPSSDLGRPKPAPRSLRPAPGTTGRAPGGQPGHPGTTLRLVDTLDRLALHRPAQCAACGTRLAPGDSGERLDAERRQVLDGPLPPRLAVVEHRVVRVTCGARGAETPGAFPTGVAQPVQYGDRLKAVGVYLRAYQLLPYARTQELLEDLFGAAPAEGTLQAAEAACAAALAAPEAAIARALRGAPVAGFDETGVYVAGRREWLHVVSTAALTHYGVHPKRGRRATDALGILPAFAGTAVHDAYPSYLHYPGCAHALCNAHVLRELIFLHEQHHQAWADELATLLVTAKDLAAAARAAGQARLDPVTRAVIIAHYDHLLWQGWVANPWTAPPADRPRRRGRPPQTKAQNLLDRLRAHRDSVLAFLDDLRVPFDNNQAERDLRMLKVQQKISGGFRTATGAAAFARIRGYVSTLRKQGLPVLAALESVFAGSPLMPSLAG
jgi:transposase